MRYTHLLSLILTGVTANAQISLEQTYTQGSSMMLGYADPTRQFLMVNLEELGPTYVMVDRANQLVHTYGLDHSSLGVIPYSSTTVVNASVPEDILYISQHLFDLDDGIEFMYVNMYFTGSIVVGITQIVDDDGSVMFSSNGTPLIRPNYHLQQYPIYATPQGTKMILSMPNGDANVYSLAGEFSVGLAGMAEETSAFPYPNPASTGLHLPYALPPGSRTGTLEVLDLVGNVVGQYQVSSGSEFLYIPIDALSAGTYTYRILTANGAVSGQQFVKW